MTTLPLMSLVLPVRGAPGSGLWGDTLDADLALLDAHDHQSGHGARIATAAININADLPFSSLYAPTQLHRVQFSEIAGAALTNPNNLSLFVSDGTGGLSAHELYYRTSAGNHVKMTSGSTLNVSAFVGGIGGDYSSVSAQLNYDDAGKRYTFKEGTVDSNGWARLAAGSLRLIEFNTTESVYVGQSAPAALASSYDMTWPTALPAASNIVAVDNTGQIAFSNTISQAVTFSAGATVATATSLTLSGTADLKHGTRTLQIPGWSFVASATDATAAYSFSNGSSTGAPLSCGASIALRQGDRILAIRVYSQDSASGPTKIQATFLSATSAGAGTAVATSAVSAGSGANQTLSITSLTTTVATLNSYSIKILTTTGTALCTVYMAEVDYDHP